MVAGAAAALIQRAIPNGEHGHRQLRKDPADGRFKRHIMSITHIKGVVVVQEARAVQLETTRDLAVSSLYACIFTNHMHVVSFAVQYSDMQFNDMLR